MVAERTIQAQIEEVRDLLEWRKRRRAPMRGREASEENEHILRLECALRTLEWVRDHQYELREIGRKNSAMRT
jgi:hypothetical protein